MGFFAALLVTLFFGGWSVNPFGRALNQETEVYATNLYNAKKKLAKTRGFSSVSLEKLPLNLDKKQPVRTIKYRDYHEHANYNSERYDLSKPSSQDTI